MMVFRAGNTKNQLSSVIYHHWRYLFPFSTANDGISPQTALDNKIVARLIAVFHFHSSFLFSTTSSKPFIGKRFKTQAKNAEVVSRLATNSKRASIRQGLTPFYT